MIIYFSESTHFCPDFVHTINKIIFNLNAGKRNHIYYGIRNSVCIYHFQAAYNHSIYLCNDQGRARVLSWHTCVCGRIFWPENSRKFISHLPEFSLWKSIETHNSSCAFFGLCCLPASKMNASPKLDGGLINELRVVITGFDGRYAILCKSF